jgi:hypothetical protein
MKNRPFLVFFVVIFLSAIALLLAWKIADAGKPRPEIAIQDGKTIDFSSGRPVVKDTAKEKASIEKSVKEMEEATKGVSFAPPAPKSGDPKKPAAKK